MGLLRLIGNIIWILTGGLLLALMWLIFGVILCITVIGIPFGRQCFKMSALVLAPFGKKVNTKFGRHQIANFLWAVLIGWYMALIDIIASIVLMISIIGIPFGLQTLKFAKLSFIPFGAEVVQI